LPIIKIGGNKLKRNKMTEISIIIEDILSLDVAKFLKISGYNPIVKPLTITKSQMVLHEVLSVICRKYNFEQSDIMGFSHKAKLVRVRYIFFYVYKTLYPYTTWVLLAEYMNKRNHATIIHGFNYIDERINGAFSHTKENREFKDEVNSIINLFK